MIGSPFCSHCVRCGRMLSNGEQLVKSGSQWVPTLCCANGDGPHQTAEEPVYNRAYWYCSAIDNGRKCLIAGPFASPEEAQAKLREATKRAWDYDVKAYWYSYGIASSDLEHRTAFGKLEAQTEEPQAAPVPKQKKRKKQTV